jgi:hypothetical protein
VTDSRPPSGPSAGPTQDLNQQSVAAVAPVDVELPELRRQPRPIERVADQRDGQRLAVQLRRQPVARAVLGRPGVVPEPAISHGVGKVGGDAIP